MRLYYETQHKHQQTEGVNQVPTLKKIQDRMHSGEWDLHHKGIEPESRTSSLPCKEHTSS